MGRASEAGFSIQPEASHTDTRSPAYIDTQETQLQLHSNPTQSPTLSHPLSSSSTYQPNAAPSKAPWKRFAIPTKNESLSSGFPFHPRLYELKITHDQWHLFTSQIVDAAKMTATEDYLAWTTGITAGTVTSAFLFVLGPVVGYYSGKAVHKKTLVKTVKEKLGEEGGLRSVLRKWNQLVFAAKGFEAWLELPKTPGELHSVLDASPVDLETGSAPMDDKKRKRVEKKAAKRFRIILIPLGEADDLSVPNYEEPPQSSRGSEAGSLIVSNERGLPGAGAEKANHNHNNSNEPPAYWDANAIANFNNTTASNTDGYHQQSQPPVHHHPHSLTEPTQDETHGPEIRYTRAGGFTNT